jgi:hypothetical protein
MYYLIFITLRDDFCKINKIPKGLFEWQMVKRDCSDLFAAVSRSSIDDERTVASLSLDTS